MPALLRDRVNCNLRHMSRPRKPTGQREMPPMQKQDRRPQTHRILLPLTDICDREKQQACKMIDSTWGKQRPKGKGTKI